MSSYIDIPGASGSLYRYALAENARPATPVSGNYVYMRREKTGFILVHAAIAENLFSDAPGRWEEAVRDHGATHLFIRLNVAGATRREELADILANDASVMNEP